MQIQRGILFAASVAGAVCLSMVGAREVASQALRDERQDVGAMVLGTMDAAVSLALDRSPLLRAAEAKRGASLGERRQADSPPNPEFSAEMENFAGTGELRGFRSAELTFGLSQKIETGGKWSLRVRAADAAVVVADRELEIARRELVRDVRKSYAEAVAAARTVEIEGERAGLAGEVVRVAQERADVGSEPEIQVRKAEIARSAAEIARERARQEFEAALRELTVLLAQPGGIRLASNQGWFDDIGQAPAGVGTADRDVEATPEWTRWDAEIARGRAALELERANRLPDPTVGAGVRRFRDTDDTAFVLGVTVPIPVFNRNRGAIDKAAQDVLRNEAEAQQARSTLRKALADAQAKLRVAWREADALRGSVLPKAEEAFAFAREGYRAGKFPLLEVLDAQRTFAEARARYVEVVREVHIQRAEVERLAGGGRGTDVGSQPASSTR